MLGIKPQSLNDKPKRFNWIARAKKFDKACPGALLEIKDKLSEPVAEPQQPASPPTNAPAKETEAVSSPAVAIEVVHDSPPEVAPRTAEDAFRKQEEFRASMEALGRSQVRATRELTQGFTGMARYVIAITGDLVEVRERARNAEDPGVEDSLRKQEQSLQTQLDTTTRSLQRVATAVSLMGSLGRENWGQAVGVEQMLAKFETILASEQFHVQNANQSGSIAGSQPASKQ